MIDIANEERVHIGEFERLLQILTGDEDEWVAEGRAEVDELATEMENSQQTAQEKNPENAESATIGSLKE